MQLVILFFTLQTIDVKLGAGQTWQLLLLTDVFIVLRTSLSILFSGCGPSLFNDLVLISLCPVLLCPHL